MKPVGITLDAKLQTPGTSPNGQRSGRIPCMRVTVSCYRRKSERPNQRCEEVANNATTSCCRSGVFIGEVRAGRFNEFSSPSSVHQAGTAASMENEQAEDVAMKSWLASPRCCVWLFSPIDVPMSFTNYHKLFLADFVTAAPGSDRKKLMPNYGDE